MAKARVLAARPSGEPVTDFLPILVRAYVPRQGRRGGSSEGARQSLDPSGYVLIFDTETATDAGQSLRFGFYQERDGRGLIEAGLFYEPEALTRREQAVLRAYAAARGMKVLTRGQFVEDVIYGFGYDLRARIVGFNLPFDLSRLA